jgi:hypothetical protein
MSALTGDTPTTTEPTSPVESAPSTPPETQTPADWRSGLTGDHASLATDKTLANIRGKDFNEVGPTLAKMVVESQKVIGKRNEGMIKVPGKDAKPEEIAAYREALGVPKVPSDYKVELPADAPPGPDGQPLAIDPARFERWSKMFHGNNMTNEQVNAVVAMSLQEEAKNQAAQREQYAQALDTLADTWGVDVFNRRASDVQSLVRHFADPDTIRWLDQTGLTNHPGLFKMLFPIAREFVESRVIEPAGDSVESDLKSLEQRIEENRAAFLKEPEGSSKRAALLDERERLLKMREEVSGSR